VAKGEDPIEQKREERRKQITFGDIRDTFLALMKQVWRSGKHYDNMHRLLTNHASSLANKAVDSITRDDIEACLRPTWTKSPDMGRRTREAIAQVFDTHGVDVNPADWRRLKRRFPSRHKVKPHSAIPYREVPRFVQQLHAEQERNPEALSPYVLEFLLLVVGRVSEVTGMRWDEAPLLWTMPPDLTWTFPAARMKEERDHIVPLSTRAVELLTRQRQLSTGEFVWPGTRSSRPLSSKSVYLYLVRTMRLPFTLHGLRSTFTDWVDEETDFSTTTRKLAIAHVAGDQTDLSYKRGVELAKRRRLMQVWCDFCLTGIITSS
jgi:integrase